MALVYFNNIKAITIKIDDVILFGALASREEDRDPIDDAVITKARTIKTITEALKKISSSRV